MIRKKNRTNGFVIGMGLLFLLISPSEGTEEKSKKDKGISNTLAEIFKLESNRDPKCHATATRLENFITGTQLSAETRFLKSKLQKKLVLSIWKRVSKLSSDSGNRQSLAIIFKNEIQRFFPYKRKNNGDIEISIPDSQQPNIKISKRDFEHYASIAYTLRAILSLQQELLLESSVHLIPLDRDSIRELKGFLEIITIAALQKSDQLARMANRYTLKASDFKMAWDGLLTGLNRFDHARARKIATIQQDSRHPQDRGEKFSILKRIIKQKVKSYQIYNQITMKVFLRNLQVYFSRLPWPANPAEGKAFRDLYTDMMTRFAFESYKKAESIACKRGDHLVREDDIEALWDSITPFSVNSYEDIIYFPELPREKQVVIEAYDCDAFRDSGIHWRYLQYVIDDHEDHLKTELDPFATELFVEGIAQYGVLLLRVAGNIAKSKGQKRLKSENLTAAVARITERVAQQQQHRKAGHSIPLEKALVSSKTRTVSSSESFFSDITSRSGINFTHRSADWLSRMLRTYLKKSKTVGTLTIPPAFGGGGIGAGDLNGDGQTDVLLLSGSGNRVYWGTGDAALPFHKADSLELINIERGKRHFGEPRQVLIVDFNNDGWQDIFITYVDDNHRLLKNLGNGRFKDMSRKSNLGGRNLTGGPAIAFDYNRDGLLDIYICYFGDYIHGILPKLSRKNLNGLPNRLYRNDGNFIFTDVTTESGTGNSGWGQALTHTDLDNDGWQDIIVGNDFGINVYYRNNGDGSFTDIASNLGTDKPSFTMNVSTTDLNNDSYPDIYISNIVTMVKDEKYVLPSRDTAMRFHPEKLARMQVIAANDLFISSTDSTGKGLKSYTLSQKVGRGYSSTGWAWGAEFLDFDNDGDDDLYCVNGMNEYSVYSETPYYKELFGQTRRISLPVYEKESNVFFVNEAGILNNRSKESGTDFLGNSRSIVYLDMDRDGDLDILMNNYHGKAMVFRNNMSRLKNHWIRVRLEGNPDLKCNRDAIGSRIYFMKNGRLLGMREIQAGQAYLSMFPKTKHFGLGNLNTIDIEIHWANGQRSYFRNLKSMALYRVELKKEKSEIKQIRI